MTGEIPPNTEWARLRFIRPAWLAARRSPNRRRLHDHGLTRSVHRLNGSVRHAAFRRGERSPFAPPLWVRVQRFPHAIG